MEQKSVSPIFFFFTPILNQQKHSLAFITLYCNDVRLSISIYKVEVVLDNLQVPYRIRILFFLSSCSSLYYFHKGLQRLRSLQLPSTCQVGLGLPLRDGPAFLSTLLPSHTTPHRCLETLDHWTNPESDCQKIL